MRRRAQVVDWARTCLPVGAIRSTTGADVVLTFDDGPDRRRTPRVIEALDRHGATATFFVLLDMLRRNPGILEEVVAAGHEIGLHGPDHRALTDLPHREALDRTRRAKEQLEDAVGAEIRWFRPPYGSQSLSSLLATRRAGLTAVLWSATTWDWKQVTPQQRWAKALEGSRPGAILLAHDGVSSDEDRHVPRPADCDTAALMDDLLHVLATRGLRGCSLGEALETGRPVRTLRLARRRGATDVAGPYDGGNDATEPAP